MLRFAAGYRVNRMILRFTKMHGLGNDFVVLNGIESPLQLSAEQYRYIADRHFGVGCDQILLVENPRDPDCEFHYRIFNADGSEVEQCGNGARCFARYVHDRGLSSNQRIDVGTSSGRISLYLEPDGRVRVNMGVPRLDPAQIPFQATQQAVGYALKVEDQELVIGVVSMGNPHAVLKVEDVARADVAKLGPQIERHPRFPQRVNAGFMQVLSRSHIKLRVYERGTGETLACGSGACAAVVAGQLQGLLDQKVLVNLPGGDLMIKWQGPDQVVWMSGPAVSVFEGRIEL